MKGFASSALDPRVRPEDDGVEDDAGEVEDDAGEVRSRFSGWPGSTGFSGSLPRVLSGFSVRPTVISSRVFLRKREDPSLPTGGRESTVDAAPGERAGRVMSVPGPMLSRLGLAKRERPG